MTWALEAAEEIIALPVVSPEQYAEIILKHCPRCQHCDTFMGLLRHPDTERIVEQGFHDQRTGATECVVDLVTDIAAGHGHTRG